MTWPAPGAWIAARPEPVVVSDVQFWLRESGSYEPDHRWLTVGTRPSSTAPARIVTDAGFDRFGLLTVDDPGRPSPSVPGYHAGVARRADVARRALPVHRLRRRTARDGPSSPTPAGRRLPARRWASPLVGRTSVALAVVLGLGLVLTGPRVGLQQRRGRGHDPGPHAARRATAGSTGTRSPASIPRTRPARSCVATSGAKGVAPYAKHPLYPLLLAGLDVIGGHWGIRVGGVLGRLLAALLAALLARAPGSAARSAGAVVGRRRQPAVLRRLRGAGPHPGRGRWPRRRAAGGARAGAAGGHVPDGRRPPSASASASWLRRCCGPRRSSSVPPWPPRAPCWRSCRRVPARRATVVAVVGVLASAAAWIGRPRRGPAIIGHRPTRAAQRGSGVVDRRAVARLPHDLAAGQLRRRTHRRPRARPWCSAARGCRAAAAPARRPEGVGGDRGPGRRRLVLRRAPGGRPGRCRTRARSRVPGGLVPALGGGPKGGQGRGRAAHGGDALQWLPWPCWSPSTRSVAVSSGAAATSPS